MSKKQFPSASSSFVPHAAVHTGETNCFVPVNLDELLAELLVNSGFRSKEKRDSGSNATSGLHAAADQYRFQLVHNFPAGQIESCDVDQTTEPAEETDAQIANSVQMEKDAPRLERIEKESFSRNRTQLYNPPESKKTGSLNIVAWLVTLGILLMFAYFGYSAGMLNSLLPEHLQHKAAPLEQRLHRTTGAYHTDIINSGSRV